MSLFKPNTRICPERHCKVKLNQTEADCRLQHECSQSCCPLKDGFKQTPVDFAERLARFPQ